MSNSAHYDRIAADYDEKWRDYNHAVSRVLLPLLPDWDGARILDVGSGTGQWLETVLRHRPQIENAVGWEPSAKMREVASAKFPKGRVEFRDGEASRLPIDEKFDGVMCLNTLHYLAQPERFFAESHRVLKVGGTLILQDYTRNGWPFFAWGAKIFDPGFARLSTLREWDSLANEAGFEVLQVREFAITRFWRGVYLLARKAKTHRNGFAVRSFHRG